MIRSLVLFLLILLALAGTSRAQTVTGKVVNPELQPVEGATIIMQTTDSLYIDACISAADGTFVLRGQSEAYCLIVQHLLYHTRQVVVRGKDAGVIQLTPQDYALEEVVVKAERPFMKVENGRLGYNLSLLPGNKTTENAYEALAKLPGIQLSKGALTLAGAEKLTVIINGKPTTMDAVQTEAFLRRTPVGRIEKAEVMYSAPPEYHVRGGVINLVMKRPDNYSFQGEISADYENRYFSSGGLSGNFRLSTPETTLDILYSIDDTKKMEYMNLCSAHTLNGKTHHIHQNEQLRSKLRNHRFRAAFEHDFNARNRLSLSYTGGYTPCGHNNSRTSGNYQSAEVDKYEDTRLHNISLQYLWNGGLEVGGDYTCYRSDTRQHLQTDFLNGEQNGFRMESGQQINRCAVYADRKHSLSGGWDLGYGASFRFAKDQDYQTYHEVTGNIHTQDIKSGLTEQAVGFYVSGGKTSATGVSFSVSVAGEYYTIGRYRRWAVYPQATFCWQRDPHLLQFALSTDKTYPGYWSMQSSVSHLNGYTELHGTPGLKPITTYALSGNYIFRQKYVFGLFFSHSSDYFTQTAYQSTERLALIYKNTNWNYMQMLGVNVALPFFAGEWLDTRLNLTGMQIRQRCDYFFDIPFDREKWTFSAAWDNTFRIRQGLFLEFAANVQTPAIQGTFDIKAFYSVSAGMKWNLAKDKISLSARCNDLFNTGYPNLKVRFKGQHLDMGNAYYSRSLTLRLAYRFGGYKQKKIKDVDTSRFGH